MSSEARGGKRRRPRGRKNAWTLARWVGSTAACCCRARPRSPLPRRARRSRKPPRRRPPRSPRWSRTASSLPWPTGCRPSRSSSPRSTAWAATAARCAADCAAAQTITASCKIIGNQSLVRWNLEFTQVLPNVSAQMGRSTADAHRIHLAHLRPGMKWSDGHPFTALTTSCFRHRRLREEQRALQIAHPSPLVIANKPGTCRPKSTMTTVKFTFASALCDVPRADARRRWASTRRCSPSTTAASSTRNTTPRSPTS